MGIVVLTGKRSVWGGKCVIYSIDSPHFSVYKMCINALQVLCPESITLAVSYNRLVKVDEARLINPGV